MSRQLQRKSARPTVYSELESLDWTFEDARTRGEAHGIHAYPAKFIPQIPRLLIERLHPGDDSAVFDPFCGSGTTLVEAARRGLPAVGVDLHPLACLLSHVKTSEPPAGMSACAEQIASAARTLRVQPPEIPALDHWFEIGVQRALSAILHLVNDVATSTLRDALRVAVSNIIVRVSNQESDTRYAAIDKGEQDTFALFVRSAHQIERALLEERRIRGERGARVQILNRDVLEVAAENINRPISIAITSPPYPNAYEYWLYHKYRMYWLGMDPIAVRQREIGARPHYFRRKPATAADFERQIGQVFRLLQGVLTKPGHACFQVGSSIIHGELIDNAALICRAAEANGFVLAAQMQREIPMTRKAFNAHHARIRNEDLLIFRLE